MKSRVWCKNMKDDSNIHGSLGPKLGEKVDPSSDIRPLTSLQYGPNGANGRTEHGIPLVTLCAKLSAAPEGFWAKNLCWSQYFNQPYGHSYPQTVVSRQFLLTKVLWVNSKVTKENLTPPLNNVLTNALFIVDVWTPTDSYIKSIRFSQNMTIIQKALLFPTSFPIHDPWTKTIQLVTAVVWH